MPRRAKPGPAALRPGTPLADNPVPGQTYGKAGEQAAAMQDTPMGNGQISAPIPPPGSNPLIRPTERPNEPVTAGMAMGPGPGPEAIPASPSQSVAAQAQMLAAGPHGSEGISALAETARALGL